MPTQDEGKPGDLLRERAGEGRRKLWFLLEADRWLVTAVFMLIVFVALSAAGYLLPSAEKTLLNTDSVDTVFQGFLTATITGVTLVLTLNQLVLSQELGSVSDQRERMEGALEFRSDTADTLDVTVSPAKPSKFLRALVQESGSSAKSLLDSVGDDGEIADDVENLTAGLVENAERVSQGLDGAQFGEFDVVSSALNFNYSGKIFAAQRIREQYGDRLGEDSVEEIERLVKLLKTFGLAREHFKTLYFQWSLINLSRRILVAAVPALVVSAVMVLFFDATAYTHIGNDTLVLLIVSAVTVAVSPFMILLAYVLRIATVTKHTLSIGPFVLRQDDDLAEIDLTDS